MAKLKEPRIKKDQRPESDASAARAYANTRVEHWQGRFDHKRQIVLEVKKLTPAGDAWEITHTYTLDWPRGSRVTRVEEEITETTKLEAVPDETDPNTTYASRTTKTRTRVYADHPTYGQVSFFLVEEIMIMGSAMAGVVSVNARGTGWV